jgi:hypothetical protein
MTSRQSEQRSFRDLMRQRPKTTEEWQAVWKDTEAHSERGSAIVAASIVESSLEIAIAMNLLVSDKDFEKLFGFNAPLAFFDAKILLGFSLGLYGKNTRNDLDVIRKIRNGFAHAMLSLSFRTPEVLTVCKQLCYWDKHPVSAKEALVLRAIGGQDAPLKRNPLPPKELYFHTCRHLSLLLVGEAARLAKEKRNDDGSLKIPSKMS